MDWGWGLKKDTPKQVSFTLRPLSEGAMGSHQRDPRRFPPLHMRESGTITQRAQRSKKHIDLDRNFQSRSKFLISLENFNLDVSISPQKIGPRWVARSKISFSIEIFNLDRNFEFFLIFGPSGYHFVLLVFFLFVSNIGLIPFEP